MSFLAPDQAGRLFNLEAPYMVEVQPPMCHADPPAGRLPSLHLPAGQTLRTLVDPVPLPIVSTLACIVEVS